MNQDQTGLCSTYVHVIYTEKLFVGTGKRHIVEANLICTAQCVRIYSSELSICKTNLHKMRG